MQTNRKLGADFWNKDRLQRKTSSLKWKWHLISHLINFIFDSFGHPHWSRVEYVNILFGLPRNLIFMALLALPFIWRHVAINGHLALSHTGNTQNPQSFLWGAREPETVAGRCPMWTMAKITHTRMHTSYTHLQNAVKDEFVLYLLQWSEPPALHKHH